MSTWYLTTSVTGDLTALADAARHPDLKWIAGADDTALISITFEHDSGDPRGALDAAISELARRLGSAATRITPSALVREHDDTLFDPDQL